MDLQTIDRLLTTTRSVRKRLDLTRPVEREVLEACLDIAVQAPTGSNQQGWHFLVLTEPEKKAIVGDYYKKAFRIYATMRATAPNPYAPDDPRTLQAGRVAASAMVLAEHMHQVPVLVIPCIEGRVENNGRVLDQASLYGSILPATWSLMLALRSRGLGSAWTTLHLMFEKEVAEALAIPSTVTQAALIPVAYTTGDDFHPAKRIPAHERTYWNEWKKI
ncbi:MAG: nitroreductase family protein [Chloroflexi bacterium]|nr:nitroreductase family protein [Chloroflexota bacterium]